MPGGNGHENEEGWGHGGKVRNIRTSLGPDQGGGEMGRFREAGSDGTIPAVLLQADPGPGPGEWFSIVYNPHGPHREERDENVRDSLVTFPSRLVPE
jgi:hypothetical protein